MIKSNQEYRLIGKFSLFTLVSIYVLILVGGIVRSTGSGMGCPDWPKCFGQWVPPTEESQLPENYKQIYSDKRAKKNERFARLLTSLGFDDKARLILEDESILEEADFNKYKTWVEYVNRVVGVLIGLFVVITFILSLRFFRKERTIFYLALASLVLVIFQGWIGSVVVSTNLITWMVTLHMLLALLIVALLSLIVFRSRSDWRQNLGIKRGTFNWVLIGCMVALMIQIVLGTQVREAVDQVAIFLGEKQRGLWVEQLGIPFLIHRSFSWVIVLLHGILLYKMWQLGKPSRLLNALGAVVVLSVLSGVGLAYAGFPAVLQPIHLLLGTLGFGLQFLLFLRCNYPDKYR